MAFRLSHYLPREAGSFVIGHQYLFFPHFFQSPHIHILFRAPPCASYMPDRSLQLTRFVRGSRGAIRYCVVSVNVVYLAMTMRG